MKLRAAAILTLLACLNLLAVIPPVQNVTLAWDTQAATNLVYRVYEVSGPITNLLATTTNLTTTLTNVLAAPHRWFVTASNIWGESNPSDPLVVPGAPVPPSNLKPVSTTLIGVPVPSTIESTVDMFRWDAEQRISIGVSNTVNITSYLNVSKPFEFMRARQLVSAAAPPFPK